MKKQVIALALVVCVGVGVMGISSRGWQSADARQADAAYRDGSFQARLDVERGRKPRISSGRWNSDQDRASFIAGYEQTYRDLAGARLPKLAEPSAAELTGFRDGVADGARDRRAAQPFQVNKTDNYRKAEPSARDYRDAYANGYQEGYYSSSQESAELRTISQK